MSGAFGWNQNHNQDNNTGGTRINNASKYQDAQQAYGFGTQQAEKTHAKRVTIDVDTRDGKTRNMSQLAQNAKLPVPEARHTLKSTAANVIIVSTDVTASMCEWPAEIFKRLPLLYVSTTEYLGTDDLEILFIAYGDAYTDQHPIQVARFGRGPELDQYLASFYTKCGGGGQGFESQELVAYYLAKRVDTSSARNVFTFFITDEAGYNIVNNQQVNEHLGVNMDNHLEKTKMIFTELRRKMHVYTILRKPDMYEPDAIKNWWIDHLGGEFLLPLDDARRVVDVILGTIASLVGQKDQFVQDLTRRQAPTRYGGQNINTVMKSILMVGKGTPSSPFQLPGNQRMLPPPKDGGTRSLLD